MTKIPIPTENSKINGEHKCTTKNFDNTTIADRLRTVSWSNNSHQTGIVKPVYGYPTFPLTFPTTKAVLCDHSLIQYQTLCAPLQQKFYFICMERSAYQINRFEKDKMSIF